MTTRIMKLATIVIFLAGFAATLLPRIVAAGEHGVSVTFKGIFFSPGMRISVDGQPDKFAISGPGPGFELTFTTTEPSFRLIVEGDRFPRVITQPYEVPKGGGELDIGRIDSPRAEGPEHTWPLVMAANLLGYASPLEMLADNKAAIRMLVMGSGAEGAPDQANESTISIEGADAKVFPYGMDTQVTFFQMTGPRIGAFLVVVPFAGGEAPDKDVIIKVTDTVTETTWDPPRPWIYDPVTVSVRNGFSTPTIRIHPKID